LVWEKGRFQWSLQGPASWDSQKEGVNAKKIRNGRIYTRLADGATGVRFRQAGHAILRLVMASRSIDGVK
jgi:hypothetical protein